MLRALIYVLLILGQTINEYTHSVTNTELKENINLFLD